MPNAFGDTEPEDAYDASDPRDIRLANIVRRLRTLDQQLDEAGKSRLQMAIADLETIRNEDG